MAGLTDEKTKVSRPPALPIFEESNMPSAAQDGMMVAVDDGLGNLKLAVSGNGQWYLFTHDSIVS